MKQLQFKLKSISVDEIDPQFEKSVHKIMSGEGKDPKESKWHSFLDSIKSDGILNPLAVQDKDENGKYKIVDGRDRFRAATQLKLKEVPCFVIGDLSPQKAIEILDKMQFLRRDTTEQDMKFFLKTKFGDLIKPGKQRNVGFKLAELINQRTGIPVGTIDRIIMEIRESMREQELTEGKLNIPPAKLQEGIKLYKDYKNLAARAKQYRSDLGALETKLKKIAPIKYFEKLDKENQKPVRGK